MDNQQETRLAYIAGLMDGEGCLIITKTVRVGGKGIGQHSYRAYIQFTNTNTELVAYYVQFLKDYEIAYHTTVDDRSDHKRACYQIFISTLVSQQRWLQVMSPWLIGKKAQAFLMLDFIERRIRRNSEAVQEHNEKGHFSNGGRARFDDVDLASYQSMKALNRGPSETARVPQPVDYRLR